MKRAVDKTATPTMKAISKRLRQEQDVRTERNKLTMSSIKDTLSIFNPMGGANDEEDFDLTNFDVKTYYANPRAFDQLPFYKRTLVVEDNQEKMKKNWKTLNKDVKRFSFWWAYGSHGPREGFPEQYDWFTSEQAVKPPVLNNEQPKDTEFDHLINSITPASTTVGLASKAALHTNVNDLDASRLNVQATVPLDLPFKHPSILASPPLVKTSVKPRKLPVLDPRSFGLKRVQQYKQDRLMNPLAKIALVLCVFLTVLCFKKDRRVNVSGVVPEYPWETVARELQDEELEKERKEREQKQKQEQELSVEMSKLEKKRWYYLWLM